MALFALSIASKAATCTFSGADSLGTVLPQSPSYHWHRTTPQYREIPQNRLCHLITFVDFPVRRFRSNHGDIWVSENALTAPAFSCLGITCRGNPSNMATLVGLVILSLIYFATDKQPLRKLSTLMKALALSLISETLRDQLIININDFNAFILRRFQYRISSTESPGNNNRRDLIISHQLIGDIDLLVNGCFLLQRFSLRVEYQTLFRPLSAPFSMATKWVGQCFHH